MRDPADGPSLPRLAAYAAPALPLAVLTLPFFVIVPTHYAASLGVPIAAVGLALLAVRVFDAVTDPVAGVLADLTTTRLGRRKVWFAAGVPLTVLSAVMVFAPPEGAGVWHLLFWGAALSLGWTISLVPYNAWGAELATTYAGRNRVAAARETVVFVGTLVALSIQAAIVDTGGTLQAFALLVAIGLPLAAIVTCLAVAEPLNRSVRTVSFAEGLGHMRANRPFLRLVTAFLVNGLANGLPATLFLFYVGERLEAPEAAGWLLLVYVACGIAGVPAWIVLSRRIGKHRAWCHAMLMACAAFIVAPFLGPGDVAIFAVVCVVTGLAVGADLVLPASLQADVIDIDTAASGSQRSATYLAVWGLATKLALAAAVGIAFPVLALAGFDPAAGIETPTGLAALAWLYAGLPVALKLVAIGLMWRFPLDAAAQAELRTRIDSARP